LIHYQHLSVGHGVPREKENMVDVEIFESYGLVCKVWPMQRTPHVEVWDGSVYGRSGAEYELSMYCDTKEKAVKALEDKCRRLKVSYDGE